jgi:hypothetical protein
VQHEAMVTDEADSSDGRAGTNEECAWRSGLNEERPTTSDVRGGGTVTRSVSDGVSGRSINGPASCTSAGERDEPLFARPMELTMKWEALNARPPRPFAFASHE